MASKPKLLVTNKNIRQAMSNKSIGYFKMSPREFLLLTTRRSPEQWIESEDAEDQIQTVEQYNNWQRDGSSIHMPWLDVTYNGSARGKIVGHEGRHRAAALIQAGWRNEDCFPVAVILREDGKSPIYYKTVLTDPDDPYSGQKQMLDLQDVPARFVGQYNSNVVKPKFSSWKSFYAMETSTMHRIESRLETA
jgi:hypothetical protein